MRVLQIGADRSKRGILFAGSPAYQRQEAYAAHFGNLDIIGFSRAADAAKESVSQHLRVIPTNSRLPILYGLDAMRIAKTLPKPDVVSAQDPFETGFAAWLIARRFGVPLHVQVHTDFLSPEYARLSIVNRLRVWIAGFVLRRAARIRVVSEHIADSVVGAYHPHASVSVIPIFVDVGAYSLLPVIPAIQKKFARFEKKVLVVSRLEPEKNVALALRAFQEATPLGSCLIIVGEGSQRATLTQLAEKLGIANRVYFEGARESTHYYGIADLVLVPSRYEGYGLVIVEALAAGKPVISTDVGVAREAGALVAEPRHFAEALKEWFAHDPSTATLKNYPYRDFDDYVRAYCDDIAACAGQ